MPVVGYKSMQYMVSGALTTRFKSIALYHLLHVGVKIFRICFQNNENQQWQELIGSVVLSVSGVRE